MKSLDVIAEKQEKYPVFYGIFGETIKTAAGKRNGSGHPLLDVVNKGEEAIWEKELKETMDILGLTTPEEFIQTYKMHPNDIASSTARFWSFMAEIYILFSVHSLGFKNIEKIKEQSDMLNPDYTAELDGERFVVEVWRRTQDEGSEEYARINPNGLYNLTQLDAELENIVELNLPKFEKQMKVYKNFKKIAAVYHPGKMVGMFAGDETLSPIGIRLLQKAGGKIDYFLFRFRFESLKDDTKSFIVPKLPKKESSN